VAGVTKYKKELIEPLVRESRSYADLIRKLGLKNTSGTVRNLKKRIEEYQLSVEHFDHYHMFIRMRKNYRKRTWQDILIRSDSLAPRVKSVVLRKAMLEYGISYECSSCSNTGIWQEQALNLEIDHIDGLFSNNLPENLRFLCPNCHSQTETFCGKKRKT
jgi:5-methylcytosine-specific restriction endonuclease McrA